jgi:uncharacterized membrane protein YhiD involved in acid resistance
MQSAPKTSPDKEIIKILEAGGVVEYLEYLQSGKRLLWINFKAGVAKGFGITVGATVVLGLLVWVLTMLMGLPVVGEYFSNAQEYITEYQESTNYEDEFAEQIRLLKEIEESNKQLISSESKKSDKSELYR